MVTISLTNETIESANGRSRNTNSSATSSNPSDKKIVEILNTTRGPASVLNRKEYEKRLLTFSASTYYAKPPSLSPLFCARFGWENVDKDMLVCSSCGAALAITLNSKLSAKTFDKLCHAYRTKIVCNHDTNCPFRLSSVDELHSLESSEELDSVEVENDEDDSEHASLDVPVYMGQVLPEDSVRLLECYRPAKIMKQKSKVLIDAIRSLSCATNIGTTDENGNGAGDDRNTWGYPRLQIPTKIRQIDSDSKLTKALGCGDISILALTLLGWNPIPNKTGKKSAGTVSLGCPFCLSIMTVNPEHQQQQQPQQLQEELEGSDNSDARQSDRTTKRQRMSCRNLNPLEAHRHYCPYKVGFPKKSSDSNPVWKIILERLRKECHENDVHKCTKIREEATGVPATGFDKSIEKVRRILRAGIAPKEIDLNA
ncbi:unnamed protein product [Pseudo-nitzschia multistriata]|uniref:C3HC-type domain-containing protein n=1 Tax=Pseudo-nitzschia multistriata TaxID=183589 RepID=A0A448ZMY6_9STRA|nr:unnamed protein product [Pseudo-nitzschia multistriata]